MAKLPADYTDSGVAMAGADDTAGLGGVGGLETTPPVRVFISYAHESKAHGEAAHLYLDPAVSAEN